MATALLILKISFASLIFLNGTVKHDDKNNDNLLIYFHSLLVYLLMQQKNITATFANEISGKTNIINKKSKKLRVMQKLCSIPKLIVFE